MRSLWSIFLVTSSGLLAVSEGSKIDSLDLLVGSWDTTIRCSKSSFANIFPPHICTTQPDSSTKSKRRQRDYSQRFQCRLHIYGNQTFAFEPVADVLNDKNRRTNEQQYNAPEMLAVKGRWTLDANPYCVTDRFYDQLVLDSYERIQKKMVDGREEKLQTVKMQMTCRLSGHFPLRKMSLYARGKLSHGVLILDKRSEENSSKRPIFAGFFVAKRLISSKQDLDIHNLEDDEKTFGY